MEQNNNFLFEKEFYCGKNTYYIVFKGMERGRKIDYSAICNRIDYDMKQIDLCDSLHKKIYFIRSIFKDYDENYLNVTVTNNQSISNVIYINKELEMYELNQKKSNQYGAFHVVYDDLKGIQLNGDLMKDIRHSVSLTSLFMREIYHLQHAMPIILDRDSKLLCEIYQLFYQESIQFHDPDIRVKIQFMMFLLSEFGISLGDKYSFLMYSKGFPCSLELSYLINRLKPYQVIEHVEDPIEIANEAKQTIQIIGEVILEYIKDKKCVSSALVHISSVLYARNYQLDFGASVDDISKHLHYSCDDVDKGIQLVKKITDHVYRS